MKSFLRIIRSRWAKINFRESGPEKIAEEEIDIPEISHTDQFESENIAETQEDVLATDNESEIGQTEMKEPELTHETSEITGRRFFDVLHFWSCVQKFKHYPSFECGMEHVTLQEEKRYGLQSTFIAVCELCGVRNIIETESKENAMNVNVAAVLGNISVRRKSRGFKYPCDAVLGNISVGAGFSQLEESLAVLNIPALPYRIYASEEEKLGVIIHKTAWKNMEEAEKEEAEIAKQLGNIDEHGFPFITVIADGAWCKRTYRVNYNSLSGKRPANFYF